jgi:hypothetical protein
VIFIGVLLIIQREQFAFLNLEIVISVIESDGRYEYRRTQQTHAKCKFSLEIIETGLDYYMYMMKETQL